MERNRSDEAPRKSPSGAALPSTAVTQALTASFFDEWARLGYAGISLERVARRVGVGKAALYRRWPDKKAMAADLLSHVGLTITDTAPQPSLKADLVALLLAIRRVLRHPRVRRILVDLHAEIERTPELAAAIRPFQAARRQRVDALLDRAIERGEIAADVDRQAAADLIGAPLYWRMAILGGRPTKTDVERLAYMIGAGLHSSQAGLHSSQQEAHGARR